MGDRLATIDMRGKVRTAVLLLSVGSWSPSNTMRPGPRPISVSSGILIHPALSLHQSGGKLGAVPLEGAAGSPTNTMSPGPRPMCLPSGILIQPFGHNRHGPKIGGSAPVSDEELGSHLTACGLADFYLQRSGMLIQ